MVWAVFVGEAEGWVKGGDGSANRRSSVVVPAFAWAIRLY